MDRAELIRRMRELPFDKEDYWLITGGAMVLYGIRNATSDIDLGCTKRMADKLECSGCQTVRMSDGTRKICYAPDVEIFEEWLFDHTVMQDGIPVITLNGLIEMKKALGREKDWRDIRLIEEHLSANETQQEVK